MHEHLDINIILCRGKQKALVWKSITFRTHGKYTFWAYLFNMIFLSQHVPQLRVHLKNLDEVLENWREYKQTVPTYGAILLDNDLTHVLLVQSYWTRASWGFPKGKVNEDEEPWKCAAREVSWCWQNLIVAAFGNQNTYYILTIESVSSSDSRLWVWFPQLKKCLCDWMWMYSCVRVFFSIFYICTYIFY